jgi:hypothetical protein
MKKIRKLSELQRKVLTLYDDLTQFSRQCAFLCDSFAMIPAKQEEITPDTLDGIGFYSRWLKTRLVEIKTEVGEIHEQLRKFEEN